MTKKVVIYYLYERVPAQDDKSSLRGRSQNINLGGIFHGQKIQDYGR